MPSLATLIACLTFLTALLTLIITLMVQTNNRYNILTNRLTALEQIVQPFRKLIEANITKFFTGNPTQELLDKVDKIRDLSKAEIIEIHKEFKKEMNSKEPSEKPNYVFMLWHLEVILNQRK